MICTLPVNEIYSVLRPNTPRAAKCGSVVLSEHAFTTEQLQSALDKIVDLTRRHGRPRVLIRFGAVELDVL